MQNTYFTMRESKTWLMGLWSLTKPLINKFAKIYLKKYIYIYSDGVLYYMPGDREYSTHVMSHSWSTFSISWQFIRTACLFYKYIFMITILFSANFRVQIHMYIYTFFSSAGIFFANLKIKGLTKSYNPSAFDSLLRHYECASNIYPKLFANSLTEMCSVRKSEMKTLEIGFTSWSWPENYLLNNNSIFRNHLPSLFMQMSLRKS